MNTTPFVLAVGHQSLWERFGSTPNKVKELSSNKVKAGFQVCGLCIHAFADEVQVGKKSPSKKRERDNDVAFTRCMPTAEHGNLKFLGWWFESTHREISDDGRTEDLFDDEIKLHVPVIPRGYTKNLGSRSMGCSLNMSE